MCTLLVAAGTLLLAATSVMSARALCALLVATSVLRTSALCRCVYFLKYVLYGGQPLRTKAEQMQCFSLLDWH